MFKLNQFALLALCAGTCSAFVPLKAPTVVSQQVSTLRSTVADDATFTSEGAQKQVGNDSFLNQNLMARAQNGPGKKNEESLKIGIVGAGLAGMVAAMDLADAGHQVEMFEVRPFVGGKVTAIAVGRFVSKILLLGVCGA